ncbi:MAG: LSU ribosomal protein L13p (L13Ae), partial [uncultured Rubrobacteraceae bacterium]
EKLHGAAGAGRAQMASYRRGGADPGAAGDGDRTPPARQEQAPVHAARRHGRFRGRGECREGSRHGEEGGAEGVLPPHGPSGRLEGDELRGDAGAQADGDPAQSGAGDDAADAPRAPAVQEVEDLRGTRASARGSEPATVRSGEV